MRVIENAELLGMVSPIKWTFLDVHNAIVNIAPEKMGAFEAEHNEFTLEYLDCSEWACRVQIEKKHIQISRSVLEIFWCLAYANIVIYNKKVEGNQFEERAKLDLTSDKDVVDGLRLMSWAFNNLLFPELEKPWPDDLPHPRENLQLQTWEHFANEFCLCATAFVIHHELAHIRLKHKIGFHSVDQEREADYAAADWIMEGAKSDELPFTKRLLGIALALQAITAKGIYTGDYGGDSHPRSFDRLFNTLSRYLAEADHVIYAITIVALQLHLQHEKVSLEPKVYEDFQECFDAYIDRLSHCNNRSMSN